MAPSVGIEEVDYEGNLLDWSAGKATGGNNTPEGKENDLVFDDDEEEEDDTEDDDNVYTTYYSNYSF